ncbi:MAG: YdbL family protein [Sphingomonadaceae bacterium]|nr:YdbL family protein [Sphingomonadaceae bacterium]
MTSVRSALLLAAVLGVGTPALAQAADPIIEAARDAGTVGEQADGYLGIRGGTPDLAKHVGQINIQRRAVYTDTAAAKTGVTVIDVAAAAGCQLLANRVAPNHYYRTTTGEWRQRAGTATVTLPAYCGR